MPGRVPSCYLLFAEPTMFLLTPGLPTCAGLRRTSIVSYRHCVRNCAGVDGVAVQSHRCPTWVRSFRGGSLFGAAETFGHRTDCILDCALDCSWFGHAKPAQP